MRIEKHSHVRFLLTSVNEAIWSFRFCMTSSVHFLYFNRLDWSRSAEDLSSLLNRRFSSISSLISCWSKWISFCKRDNWNDTFIVRPDTTHLVKFYFMLLLLLYQWRLLNICPAEENTKWNFTFVSTNAIAQLPIIFCINWHNRWKYSPRRCPRCSSLSILWS